MDDMKHYRAEEDPFQLFDEATAAFCFILLFVFAAIVLHFS